MSNVDRRARARIASGAVLLALATSPLSACFTRDAGVVQPCVRAGFQQSIHSNQIDKLDLLFLIDSSPTMVQEQASLREQIPRLVGILTTGDLEAGTPAAGGVPDFQPIADIHVAVTTQDGGSYGIDRLGCSTDGGDDGLLSMPEASGRRVADATCPSSFPTFLPFRAGETNTDDFVHQFDCLTRLGTGGCGFEQPLEMIVKSMVDPAFAPPGGPFLHGGVGHGGETGPNAGFLRDDSVLAVILVTDEDDCSVSDPTLYDPDVTLPANDDPNVRCAFHHDHLFGVERFVAGLRAIRPDPNTLVFSAIVGVPVDLVDDVDGPLNDQKNREGIDNLDAVLADERMVIAATEREDFLVPACEAEERGVAYPARRIVELTRDVGGVVQSICQSDFGPAIDVIVRRIASALDDVCLPRRLASKETGIVTCDVHELLPVGAHCADFVTKGREAMPLEIRDDGREVCVVTQRETGRTEVPTEPGWYYDDFTEETLAKCLETPQRVAFVKGAEPVAGASIELACAQAVSNAQILDEGTGIGAFCDPSAATDPCAETRIEGQPLFCEASTRSCELACLTTEDCPGSMQCDLRTAAEDGPRVPRCVNPVCR